jgi:hypothetical protein
VTFLRGKLWPPLPKGAGARHTGHPGLAGPPGQGTKVNIAPYGPCGPPVTPRVATETGRLCVFRRGPWWGSPLPQNAPHGLAQGGGRPLTAVTLLITSQFMALSNAEKQKRWREKRNRLARQASTIGGLIELLARSVRNKRDREIEDVIARVTDHLRRVIQERQG